MAVEVLLYGRLAEVAGARLAVQTPENWSVADLRSKLASEHPELAEAMASRRVRACIADAFVADDAPIGGAPRVEFFPAVSGG